MIMPVISSIIGSPAGVDAVISISTSGSDINALRDASSRPLMSYVSNLVWSSQ